MQGEYPIHFGDTVAGTVIVEKEGMFWLIRCRCSAPTQVPTRVQACWADKSADLGICAKMGDVFGLTARLKRKEVPTGIPVFRMAVISRGAPAGFIPISPEEPFAYISRLKHAFLTRWDGKPGITLADQSEMDNPTGQWSEPRTSEYIGVDPTAPASLSDTMK